MCIPSGHRIDHPGISFHLTLQSCRYLKLKLWKFCDFKHFTSLKLLAQALGIPSPKEDIDGGMVRDMFYEANDLERIT